jgi:hypothetical protein
LLLLRRERAGLARFGFKLLEQTDRGDIELTAVFKCV